MKIGRWALVGLAAAVVAACGRDEPGLDGEAVDRTGYEELTIAADTAEGFEESEEAAPVVPVQGARGPAEVTPGGPLTATGNLRGVAGDAPPGTVTVTEADGVTAVLVKVDRYTPGVRLRASVAAGACDASGIPVTRVGQVFTVGADGIGTVQGRVPIATREVLDGRHSVRVHTADGATPDMVLACADLPRVGSQG